MLAAWSFLLATAPDDPPLVAFLDAAPWFRTIVADHRDACLLDEPPPRLETSTHVYLKAAASPLSLRLRGVPVEQHRLNLDADPALETLGIIDTWACNHGDVLLLVTLDDDETVMGTEKVYGVRGVRLHAADPIAAVVHDMSPMGVVSTETRYDAWLRPVP